MEQETEQERQSVVELSAAVEEKQKELTEARQQALILSPQGGGGARNLSGSLDELSALAEREGGIINVTREIGQLAKETEVRNYRWTRQQRLEIHEAFLVSKLELRKQRRVAATRQRCPATADALDGDLRRHYPPFPLLLYHQAARLGPAPLRERGEPRGSVFPVTSRR